MRTCAQEEDYAVEDLDMIIAESHIAPPIAFRHRVEKRYDIAAAAMVEKGREGETMIADGRSVWSRRGEAMSAEMK